MKMLITILLILSVTSCKPKIEEPIAAPSIEGVEGIEGTWNLKPTCKQSSSSYLNIAEVFTQTIFSQITTVYSNSSCTTPILTFSIAGTYVVSNITHEILEEQGDLDSTLLEFQITLNNSTLVTDYNTSSECGYNDWQLNVPKDVLGKSCDGSTLPSAGTVEYSIYRKVKVGMTFPISLIQTNPGDLYFGTSDSTHNGTAPSQRFVSGSLSYIYAK